MKYENIVCGMKVRVPSGEVGKVVGHDANFSLSFGGGGFVPRTRGLKATVRIGETRREYLISRLRAV